MTTESKRRATRQARLSASPGCVAAPERRVASELKSHYRDGSFAVTDMRFAFVIRLGQQTRPEEGAFEGSVEEVDSCMETRFRTAAELLTFLGRRFEIAKASASAAAKGEPATAATDEEDSPSERKQP